jgi:hypothetical protein
MAEPIKEKYKEITNHGKINQLQGFETGIPIYLDLEYDVLMNDREIRSLAL